MGEPHRDAIFVASEGLEDEQHEPINAVYLVAHEGDQVLSGERPLRTDDECPSIGVARQGYSIRGAHLRHLPDLPADLYEGEPPRTATVWEPTRLSRAILTVTIPFLKDKGADTDLFASLPAFMRMARSMGYDPRPLGRGAGIGDSHFLAFCGVI